MIMSASGVVIRTTVEGIRIVGRSSQGVSLMKPDADDKVISITVFESGGGAVEKAARPVPCRGSKTSRAEAGPTL